MSDYIDPAHLAHLGYNGHYAAVIKAAEVRDALDDMVRELRAAGVYVMADKLRALADKLNTAVSYPYPELTRKPT